MRTRKRQYPVCALVPSPHDCTLIICAEDDALNDVVAELLHSSPTTSSSSASQESARSSREAKDASTGNERLLRQAASFASVKQVGEGTWLSGEETVPG